MESFEILDAEGGGKQQWLDLLDRWPCREVFAHPSYPGLFLEPGHRPICAVYRCSEGSVLYPMILRDLRRTGYWGPTGAEAYDLISPPYGYGGPFVAGHGERSSLLARFFRAHARWAESRRVVCEYHTFAPQEEATREYPGDVVVRMHAVVRTLDLSAEALFRDYKDTVQRHIKGALRKGVVIETDRTGAHQDDFLAIYEATMNRRNASSEYRLSRDLLSRFRRGLQGYFVYFYALLDGRAVSAELVLLCGDSTFFFRGGTLAEGLRAKANHLLKHAIILWSREQGKRCYILGGGNGHEDPLYRYKLSFAPGGARPLRVGKWILDGAMYSRLVEARRSFERARGVAWKPRADYFPAYRAPAEAATAIA